MKLIWNATAAGLLLAGLAIAQAPARRYIVTDLGTLPGGKFSQASSVTEDGTVIGIAALPDGTQHAVLWEKGKIKDLVAPGSEALNSGGFSINEKGQASIQAETAQKDPNHENFCLYGTGLTCRTFLYQKGVMTLLPTLGGYNSTVGTINSKGEIAGIAETGKLDPHCSPDVQAGGNGPQLLDFEAVVWGPDPGQIRELRPLQGDTVGEALAINESGQVVGASGTCANTMLPPIAYGSHAVLWEKDGLPRDLGNLGTAVLNIALAVNNQGQAVGFSSLNKDSSPFQGTHAFLWKKETGMQDLGTLPGDSVSGGEGINEAGDVAGVSFDAEGNPRAFLWQNGKMSDLNALAPGSPLFLLFAFGINSRGQIAGFGATEAGEVHAYLATPAAVTAASAGPKNASVTSRQISLDGTASTSVDGKPLSYLWSIPEGQGNPSAAILQSSTATPTVQFGTARGIYTFQLTITDSTGASASDVVTVDFEGN